MQSNYLILIYEAAMFQVSPATVLMIWLKGEDDKESESRVTRGVR